MGNTGATTSTGNEIAGYYHLMRWNSWSYTGVGGFQQSSEQNIDLQSNIGSGIGRYLKNTKCTTIVAYGGLLYQNSKYTQSATHQPDQNPIAGLAGVGVELFKFNQTNLTVKASVFPASFRRRR